MKKNELLEKVHAKSQIIKDYNDVKRIVKYTIDNLKKQNDNDSDINETLNKLEFIKTHLSELTKLYNGSMKVLEKYVEYNLHLTV